MPDPFELLSETEWDRASSVTDVPDEFEDAAAVIWEYKIYNPLIILVLQLYFSRPEGCNKRQHPTLTSFARSHFQTILSDYDATTIVNQIIDNGMHKQGREMEFIFDHDDHAVATADPLIPLSYQLKE